MWCIRYRKSIAEELHKGISHITQYWHCELFPSICELSWVPWIVITQTFPHLRRVLELLGSASQPQFQHLTEHQEEPLLNGVINASFLETVMILSFPQDYSHIKYFKKNECFVFTEHQRRVAWGPRQVSLHSFHFSRFSFAQVLSPSGLWLVSGSQARTRDERAASKINADGL